MLVDEGLVSQHPADQFLDKPVVLRRECSRTELVLDNSGRFVAGRIDFIKGLEGEPPCLVPFAYDSFAPFSSMSSRRQL